MTAYRCLANERSCWGSRALHWRRCGAVVLAICGVALSICPAKAGLGADRSKAPNLILIMADDFGYECVTANGGQSYQTPVLDRLTASGMRFQRCHVQPLCTPTRVQLMTGMYNVRNYIRFGLLDPQATTFAHLLKKAGYRTGIAGKWQLGGGPEGPRHFGFDESLLWQQTRRPPRYANPGLEINGVEKDYENGEYGPKLINDFALDFVARHKDQPFFLYYPMILTHNPFQPTPDSPDWDPKARGEQVHQDVRHFAEMTAYMDKMIGRLVGKLEELGLREKTLLLFLGDNGTNSGVVSQFQGGPYRGGKGSTTARGTHVPLVANWPSRIAPGQVNSNLIDSTDFLPTLCEAACVQIPAELQIDGRSFLPQLLGQAPQQASQDSPSPSERPAAGSTGSSGARSKPREWIYCWYARDGGPAAQHESAMDDAWKLYRDGRFFDLARDAFEEHPLDVSGLSGPAAVAAKKLQAVLDQYAHARPAELSRALKAASPRESGSSAGENAKKARRKSKPSGK